jgi:hypothetical protein
MARENVEIFMQKALDDSALLDRLIDINQIIAESLGENYNEASRAKLITKHILPIAIELGCPFTLEDYEAFERGFSGNDDNYEMDETSLGMVAGGKGISDPHVLFGPKVTKEDFSLKIRNLIHIP